MRSVILTIDTSTSCCSAALCGENEVLSYRFSSGPVNHSQLLPRYIDELLQYVRSYDCLIDGIAVSSGPGSYTGLRIGVSTAKGLAYGLSVPLLAIPTLQVLCASFLNNHSAEKTSLLCPMVDARRMEVYTALYDSMLNKMTGVEARVVTDKEWLLGKGEVCYFGDGAAKCRALLEDEHIHYVEDIVPDARSMGGLAYRRLRAGMTEDVAYLEPFYLKEFVAAPSHIKGLQSK